MPAPHMRVIVDGNVLMDDVLEEWQRKPTGELANMIRPGVKPKPWMKALLVVLAHAALAEEPTRFEVNTMSRGRWSLSSERLE